jgi:hypothetical protein
VPRAHATTRAAANNFRPRLLVIVLLFIFLVLHFSDFELRETLESAGTHNFLKTDPDCPAITTVCV